MIRASRNTVTAAPQKHPARKFTSHIGVTPFAFAVLPECDVVVSEVVPVCIFLDI